MKKYPLISLILLLFACSSQQGESIAHITQRRVDEPNKLMINYQFLFEGKRYLDSVEVRNRVIPHDSLKVVFPVGHPEKSRLLIP